MTLLLTYITLVVGALVMFGGGVIIIIRLCDVVFSTIMALIGMKTEFIEFVAHKYRNKRRTDA